MAERRMAIGLLGTLTVACSQLLGIDDLGYHPDAAGDATAPDAGGIGDGSTSDTAPDRPCGTADDPSNCGVCGHDCLGGTCAAGVCQPATMYSSGVALQALLATDGTSIFFRTSTQVLSCPATQVSCSTNLVRNTSAPPPMFLAAALGHVYWNEGNTVYGCATATCNPTQYMSTAPATLYGIGSAVKSPLLLAVDQDTTPTIRVWEMGLDDVSPMPTQIINYTSGGPAAPNQVAATPSSTRAFWSQFATPTLYMCQSGACGSTPDGTVPAGSNPVALVATPAALYVATASGVKVAPVTLTSSPTSFAGTHAVTAIAANPTSTELFYAEQATTNNVVECSTSGSTCTPAILQMRSNAISALAADGTAVYWIEGNSIMRLVL